MRTEISCALRSSNLMGGGLGVGGSLIVALLIASPQRADCQSIIVQLTPSNYSGYAVSCFGAKDGSLDLTVSGGVPPYFFEWSNGATTEDLSALAAGYYRVGVSDSNGGSAFVEITLEQPEPLNASADAFEYPNEFHISCHSCYNGSIDASASGGVQPYVFAWHDGTVQEDRTGLGARDYTLTVSDANGCSAAPVTLTLREPERNDWTMTGNVGTNPTWQYLGTADNKDLAIGTNGQQRMRIHADGTIRMNSLGFSSGYTPLWVDSTGMLRSMDLAELALYIEEENRPGCPTASTWPWHMCGDHALPENFIGTTNAAPLIFKTDAQTRMWIDATGKVGIGSVNMNTAYDYGLYLHKGLLTEKVKVAVKTTSEWSDHVFGPGYALMPLEEVQAFIAAHEHLPGVPRAECMVEDGLDVVRTDAMLLQKVEELTLHLIAMDERLRALEHENVRLRSLTESQH